MATAGTPARTAPCSRRSNSRVDIVLLKAHATASSAVSSRAVPISTRRP